MVECPHPDCAESEKDFHSEATMRQHHTKVHGKQLPNCTCDACGEDFFHKGARRKHCDDCKDGRFEGENNPNYSGAKEATECRRCGKEFKYYPSEKEGVFCPDCVEDGANVVTSSRFGRKDGADPAELRGESAEMVELDCSVCSETFTRPDYKLDGVDNPVCSNECSGRLASERMKGDNNPRWNGGVNWDRKYGKRWAGVRERVYERDDGRCQICNAPDSELPVIHAHHIVPVDEFEEEDDAHYEENALLLCPTCHPKVEQGTLEIPETLIERKGLEKYQ